MRTSFGPISGTGTSSSPNPGSRSRFTRAGIVLLTATKLDEGRASAILFPSGCSRSHFEEVDGLGWPLCRVVLEPRLADIVDRAMLDFAPHGMTTNLFLSIPSALAFEASFRMLREWLRRSSASPQQNRRRRALFSFFVSRARSCSGRSRSASFFPATRWPSSR